MSQPNDYLAVLKVDPEDAEQAGVRGMKWGVRNSRSTLKSNAAAKKGEATKPTPKGNIQDNVESSTARYDRIAGQARSGRASDLTEQDLKFFNARTDALAKINKMTETKPGWLQETATGVLQNAAKNQMQSVADALATKYVGAPITDSIGKYTPKAAVATAAAAAATAAAATAAAATAAASPKSESKSTVDSVKVETPATEKASTPSATKPALQGQTMKEALADIRKRAKDFNAGR